MRLDSNVALVTGASRGIGKAVALELSRSGYRIAVNFCTDEDGARETVELIERAGGVAATFKADVASHQACREMIDSIEDSLGPVEVAVLNAGITRDALLARMSEEDWDRVMDVDLKGVYNVGKWVTRPMMRRRAGRIVAISSVVALTGNPGQANYCAAKAGVIGFIRALSREVARYGITANVVAPGYILTDMTGGLKDEAKQKLLSSVPLGRPGVIEDVAYAVAFLASSRASYITGQVLPVDGGMSLGALT